MAAVDLWAPSAEASLHLAAYDGPDDGPAVVVLHGLVAGVDVLRDAVRGFDPFAELAAQGCHVLALDWPGHGRSGGRRGRLTYRGAMEAAAAAVAVARERWGDPVGLFGAGLGGALAFYAALERVGVGAVACHDVLDLRDVRAVLQRWRQGAVLPLAAALTRLAGREALARIDVPASLVLAPSDMAADPSLSRALRRHPQSVRRYDLEGLASILLTPEDKPDIAAQTVPTLLAVGSEDRVLPQTTTRAFSSRLTCPHELWVLPGAGHQLLLEHPRALLPTVARFLRDALA